MNHLNRPRLQKGKLRIPLGENKSLSIPIILFPVSVLLIICLCCFGWITADATLREIGILPTYTPTLTPTPTATNTVTPTPTPTPTVTPTDTPEPTNTSIPPTLAPTEQTGCTWRAAYVADVTVPDGTRLEANERFEKTWKVRNAGTCIWDEVELSFSDGNQMTTTDVVPVEETQPDREIEVSVAMRAPSDDGSYSGVWSLCYRDNCFYDLTVNIVVGVPVVATQAPAVPTVAPTQPPPAAVCDCSHDAYNCGDFGGSWRAAQNCFEYCVSVGRGDIHRLDQDNNGVACESLR